ncbi:MAG: DUF3887 domain-containing protein [Candidatus Aegiribacteria sp.]|nr:DUF3887 domain-containing protein [Candidatus Aegiribacteria sp.]
MASPNGALKRGIPFLLLLLVSLSGFLGGCGSTEEESRSEELTAKATKLVESMIAGDFSTATENFDTVMKDAFPSDKLEDALNSLVSQVGAFQKQTGTHIEETEEYLIVYVTCEFENSIMDIKVVFNAENQVAGLFFVPATGSTE